MPTFGIFQYTNIDSQTIALGTGSNEGCNGFVSVERASGHIIIPNYIQGKRVTKLSRYSLRRCDLITKLTLPSTLIEISDVSLSCLYSISELIIPASVIKIGERIDTLQFITKLVIERDSRLETIGDYFLQKSYALTEVIIPSSVKSIGSNFCMECIILKNIVFCGSSDFSSLSIAFYNCSKYEKAIVSNDYLKSTFGSKPVEAVDFRNCFPYFTCFSAKKEFAFKSKFDYIYIYFVINLIYYITQLINILR